MNKSRVNDAIQLDNSFLLSSIIVIIYSKINPSLFALSTDRVSYAQVFNAINWPLNHAWPFLTGLTAWTPVGDIKDGVYFVEILPYLPSILARLVLDINKVFQLQRAIDIAVIIGGISLFAELIANEVIHIKKKSRKIILKFLIINSFILSPWSAYLLYKSTWQEPLFMLILLAAMISLCKNKIILGTILLTLSSLVHYHYMFFISIYFISGHIIAVFKRGGYETSWTFPKIINLRLKKNSHKILWSSIGILAFLFNNIRQYFATILIGISPNEINASSALSRIGLDGNVHSGGLIGSMQFLGGYKWYYCFSIHNTGNNAIFNLDNKTMSAIVNCGLVLLTIALFSAISIYGVLSFYRLKGKGINTSNLWVPNILIFSYLGMLLIFQQSFTVHIVGYSYVWAFIFALGISVAVYRNFIIRTLPWKIVGLFLYFSCANSLIQSSFYITEIRRLSLFF